MHPIRIVVIGLGIMGRQHVRVLRELPQFELVGVHDPDPQVTDLVLYDLPDVTLFRCIEDVVRMDITAAVVASPTAMHAEQTEFLVSQGIHVLVEKPVAGQLSEALRLEKIAEEVHTCILVGHIERFNPAVGGLKSFLNRGELGDIMSISARRVGVARPARPTTNVVFDLAIHDIDVVRFVMGQEVSVVGAIGGFLPGNVQEDYAHLLLECGPTTAAIEANWITPRKSRRLSITGTAGLVELDYIRQEVRSYRGKTEFIGDSGDLYRCIAATAEPSVVPVDRAEPLRLELEHFHACIVGAENPIITMEEAVSALRCCDEATRLIRYGGRVTGC